MTSRLFVRRRKRWWTAGDVVFVVFFFASIPFLALVDLVYMVWDRSLRALRLRRD